MQALKKNFLIGDWVLDKELGSGGQGVVWKVRYSRDKHSPPAALKICSNPSTKARARFAREVAFQRDQKDPGIVCVRDAGEHSGAPYYVMELASSSLDRVITADTAGTRLVRESGSLLLMFLRQACLALSNLHVRGILHRDIKPSNVLLMLDPPEPMKAVLADLGLAVLEEDQGELTAVHEVVGTAIFRAPESLVGAHSRASDVYAFGKTLEFVFAGGLPSGVGPGRCSRSPLFANELWDCLDDVLHRACAFHPVDRFQNAGELLAALPETIVTRSGFVIPVNTPADTTLSAQEMLTLVSVIEACPAITDWITPHSLRKEVDPHRIPVLARVEAPN